MNIIGTVTFLVLAFALIVLNGMVGFNSVYWGYSFKGKLIPKKRYGGDVVIMGLSMVTCLVLGICYLVGGEGVSLGTAIFTTIFTFILSPLAFCYGVVAKKKAPSL